MIMLVIMLAIMIMLMIMLVIIIIVMMMIVFMIKTFSGDDCGGGPGWWWDCHEGRIHKNVGTEKMIRFLYFTFNHISNSIEWINVFFISLDVFFFCESVLKTWDCHEERICLNNIIWCLQRPWKLTFGEGWKIKLAHFKQHSSYHHICTADYSMLYTLWLGI